jgi:hypothetical protein
MRRILTRDTFMSTHRVVSDVVATCEIQFLIYFFFGVMMDFLTDPDCHILVPSFTVKFPNDETNDILTRLANEIDELTFTTGLIHEIVANAVQAEIDGWDRETAKENIKASLEEFCIEDEHDEYTKFVDDLLASQLRDEFLDVYDQVVIIAAWLLGRYALNSFQASKETVVKRFQQAVQVAQGFHSKPNTWTEFLAFIKYLNQNLPDFNEDRCPLEGNCLARKLESLGQSCPPGMSNEVMHIGATIMSRLGCGQKSAVVIPEITGDIGVSNIGLDVFRLLIRTHALHADTNNDFVKYLQSVMRAHGVTDLADLDIKEINDVLEVENMHQVWLNLVAVDQDSYKVNLNPYIIARNIWDSISPLPPEFMPQRERWFIADTLFANAAKTWLFEDKDDTVFLRSILWLEALWEQLSLGEGPFCFCDPYMSAECVNPYLFAKVWEQTEADPPDSEGMPNWKLGDQPECIRYYTKIKDFLKIKEERTPEMRLRDLVVAVNFLLMSRKLNESEKQSEAGMTLEIYQRFIRDTFGEGSGLALGAALQLSDFTAQGLVAGGQLSHLTLQLD